VRCDGNGRVDDHDSTRLVFLNVSWGCELRCYGCWGQPRASPKVTARCFETKALWTSQRASPLATVIPSAAVGVSHATGDSLGQNVLRNKRLRDSRWLRHAGFIWR